MTTMLQGVGVAPRQPTPGPRRPGRVLMTADAVGGVWRYAVDLASASAAHGVTTTIVVMGPPPSADQRREAARAGVPIIDHPCRLEWMDGGLDDLDATGQWLLTLERALCPDVVHLNGYAHAALPWSAPVVVVAHSCVRTWWRAVHASHAPDSYARYTTAVSRGLAAARVVVAPSDAMLRDLRDEYAVAFRGCVVPNGHARSTERRRRRKEPFVLAAGRAWDRAKNVAALCTAAPLLSWPTYVAGETQAPDGHACSLAGVHALGHLSSRAMRAWYERASIYALPARYEPFGLSVLEAAGAGCALVLGDIPSLRETWQDAAVYVRPDDHAALARALQRLIDHPDERLALGQRAVARARRFSIDRTAAAYARLYEDVLA